MAQKIDAKFEVKLTCGLKNDTKNLANFHRLKNRNFILESKMTELNKHKNSKQPSRPDAVGKLYFTLEITEQHNVHYIYFQNMMAASEKLIEEFCETIS